MTKAIDCLYRLAARNLDDEARVADEMAAPGQREAEAKVRTDMDAWVRDCVAAIAHSLTGHGGGVSP